MLPDNELILTEKGMRLPKSEKRNPKISYELGGVGFSDPSEPFTYEWKSYVDGNRIMAQREGLEPQKIKDVEGRVNEVSLTFDQNMRPTLAYVEEGVSKLYWYDTAIQDMRVSIFDVKNPRVSLDDTRKFNIADSDIIFGYISKDNKVKYRLQRERFSIEHDLEFDRGGFEGGIVLNDIGMGVDNRFVFSVGFKQYGEDNKMEQPQLARLAYPEAAWIASCGNEFPSRVQWLHKYLSKVDVLPSKGLKDKLPESGYPNTTSVVMKNRATVGSGKTSQGVPIHEQVSLDWVKWAISRKVWRLLYTKDKVNATEAGKELIINEVKDVLNVAVEEGIFIKYDISGVTLDSKSSTISIKFSAELEQTILYVDVSGSLYH